MGTSSISIIPIICTYKSSSKLSAIQPADHRVGFWVSSANGFQMHQSLRSHPGLGRPGWICVCFAFTISRLTIVKRSTSYFAGTSPAITAASLSSIWFQPSI